MSTLVFDDVPMNGSFDELNGSSKTITTIASGVCPKKVTMPTLVYDDLAPISIVYDDAAPSPKTTLVYDDEPKKTLVYDDLAPITIQYDDEPTVPYGSDYWKAVRTNKSGPWASKVCGYYGKEILQGEDNNVGLIHKHVLSQDKVNNFEQARFIYSIINELSDEHSKIFNNNENMQKLDRLLTNFQATLYFNDSPKVFQEFRDNLKNLDWRVSPNGTVGFRKNYPVYQF